MPRNPQKEDSIETAIEWLKRGSACLYNARYVLEADGRRDFSCDIENLEEAITNISERVGKVKKT
jgi:hypothetical protein